MQAVLDHAPDAFVSMAGDGRIIEWNLQAERMFGWSRAEALGCTVAELIVPPQAHCAHEHGVARYLQTGEAHVLNRPIEVQALRKDGGFILVELTIAAVGSAGETTFNAFMRDISARKASEQALATSEERLRLMVENVEDYAIFMLDTDGRVATWNAGARRLKGYPAEEIIGRHFSVFYPPEDVAAGKPGSELRIAAAEGRLEDEGWRVTRDGTRFWANVVITALRDADGTLRGYGKITRDLTERRAVEQAQRAAHVLFETAFADAPIGMALVGLDGSWLKVNRALCQIVGWSEAELLARTFQDITHPDDLDADLAHIAALVRGDTDSYQMEKRYFRRCGEVIWVKLSVTLVRDASGAPEHFISQIEDITGSREAQRALAGSEARLQAIFEHVPAGMALRDIDGRYEHVNAYVTASLGREREQMLGRRTEDLFPQLAERVRSQDAQLLAAGGSLVEEMSVPLGDGTSGDFHVVRYPVRDADGTVTGLGSFSIDITERKRVERELAEARRDIDRFFGLSLDVMAIANDAGHFVRVNPAFTDTLGYSLEDLTGRPFAEFVHPDDLAATLSLYAELLAGSRAVGFENRYLCKDGSFRWLLWNATAVEDGFTYCTARDITERKQLEDSVREAEELLALSFDHSPLGMTLSTPDRGLVRLNQAFADMLGCSVQELMANQHPTRYTHPDDHAVDREHIRALLDGDTHHTQWDKRYIHAKGHTVWARISLSVLHYPDGSPRHFVSQIEDISERRQHEAEERALRDVAELVAAGAEPPLVFSAITEQVRELFDSSVSAVIRFDRPANRGVIAGASTSDGADLVGTTFDLQTATATAEVFCSGKPARIDAFNLTAEDPLSPTVQHFGLTGSVAAPVQVSGELWGAVVAAAAEQHIAAGAELRLERFAHLASLAITNIETLETLEHRAATDPLTGIANHRTFHDRLRSEVERGRRYGRDLSVVLLDLDHFKAINDTHGHQTGDQVLKKVAQRLAGEAREGELVARIGGEEFAWLIPESDPHDAYAAAERVRRAIETTPFADVGTVTLSAGVCSTTHAHDAQQLMRNADRALYRAKENGRNNTSVNTTSELIPSK
ncbi:MAG: PAS domain S-box protein [Solirubrobacteraceae bacterium]